MGKSKDGNKVKYGLRNVHYALLEETQGVVTYQTPVAFPGAVSLSLEAKGDTLEEYADDNLYFVITNNQGYGGDLEMELIPDSFRVDVLGCTLDSNGVLVENKDNKIRDIALLFEFDGDKNKTRHVLYKVSVSRPKLESSTGTGSIEVKHDTLSIVASPAVDTGNIKAKVSQEDTPYERWYNSVYLGSVIPPASGENNQERI